MRQEEDATAGEDPHLRRMRDEAERIGLQLRLTGESFQLVNRDGGDVVITGTLDEITEALTR